MKKRFVGKRKANSSDFELQVTALADILMVVLVFLLKAYSNGINSIEDISLPKDLRLPVVQDASGAKDGLQIQVNSKTVELNGKTVVSLRRFRFPAGDLNQDLEKNGSSNALMRALSRQRPPEENGQIWVIADRRAPYATVQTILASAANTGFTDIRLAVIKED